MSNPLLPKISNGQMLRVELVLPETKVPKHAVSSAMPRAAALSGNATAQSAEFHTNGWDTVYALRASDVNAIISNRWVRDQLPTAWEAQLPASLFTPKIDGAGTFSAWRLTLGGSGSLVHMEVPFTATVTCGSSTTVVTGGKAYIEISLTYLPQAGSPPALTAATTPPGFTGGVPLQLKVRLTDGTAAKPIVAVLSVEYDSPTFGPDQQDQKDGLDNALIRLLQKWFNANLAQFSHVFATVNLGAHADTEDFQWMLPTSTSYAYVDGVDLDSALLGVLAMTENRPPTGAIQELTPGAVPNVPGATAGFSISLERFLEKMVFPALPLEFTKVDASAFKIAHNDTQIVNTRTIPLDPVRVGLLDYTPEITKFNIAVVADEIQTYSFVHIPISPGIDAYAEITDYATICSTTKSDGSQTLTFKKSRASDEKSWYTVAAWVTAVEITGDVIMTVVAAVIGGVVAKVKSLLVKIIIALVTGGVVAAILEVVQKIPEWIAEAAPDALPPIDPLVKNATGPTLWTGYREFSIKGALMNGAFQLGGVPLRDQPTSG